MASDLESLQQHRIGGLPGSMYYIQDFITSEEERSILQAIPNRWVSLSHRRLQAIPARLSTTNTLLASPLPAWLTHPVLERFDKLGIFAGTPHGFNHCLINEYLPGQGIMPHEDGAAYHPVVATVSLGGTIVLDVSEKVELGDDCDSGKHTTTQRQTWRIVQEPRSLLVTTGSAYTDTLHGIAEVIEDDDLTESNVANWHLLGNPQAITENEGRNKRTTRISLTFRDVRKVAAIGGKLFGRPKT